MTNRTIAVDPFRLRRTTNDLTAEVKAIHDSGRNVRPEEAQFFRERFLSSLRFVRKVE